MGGTNESVIPYRENDISKLDVSNNIKIVLWIHLDPQLNLILWI